jgi:capsular polysaccharide transport system permease protein
MLISGAILPLNFLPHDILKYLMWNPIVHGLELLRGSFMAGYRPLDGTDPVYFWFWMLSLLLIGLMMHLRYEPQLKAK